MVSLIVEPIWNGILIFAGYRLGDYIAQLDRGLRIVALIGSAVMVWVFVDIYRRMLRRISWRAPAFHLARCALSTYRRIAALHSRPHRSAF
ncbi:MAG: hypothetical protein V9H26_25470 [Verrucomicrobiota bacterium]